MAIGVPIIFGGLAAAIVAGLALSGSGSSSSSSSGGASPGGPTGGGGGGGGGTGAGGLDLMTCAQAFDAIPDIPSAGVGTPSLKQVVLAAVASPALTTAEAEMLAVQLEKLGAIAPDAQTRNAMHVAAQCLREHAIEVGKGSGSGPLPDAMSCDAAFGALPEPYKSQIIAARNAGTATAKAFADNLDALAALVTDPSTKTAMQVGAKCLRAGGGSATGAPGLFRDEFGNYSRAGGLPPRAGVASNPVFQWEHTVIAGDNASRIAAAYFGSGATRARVDELINHNPREVNGRNLGPIRSDWPPGTPGQTPGVLNWTSLIAGDRLSIPKSWNAWIDETAKTKHDATPWPAVA
jgi:hypothetical protein